MSQVIRLSADLYRRLEQHAKGFDTPMNVIERLLDYYEAEGEISELEENNNQLKPSTHLEDPIFNPSDPQVFKEQLLIHKIAWVLLEKTDGSREVKEWNAKKLKPESNVMSNLRSGYLRGWKEKGITRISVAINKDSLGI